MKVSVNEVWDETLAFIRVERGLIVPLALGTLYFSAILVVALSFVAPAFRGVPVLILTAWGIVGQLALIDLVVEPQRSVREALVKGIQTLPMALVVLLLFGALLLLAAAPILYGLATAGYTVEQLIPIMNDQAQLMKLTAALPAWTGLYTLLLTILCLFVFIRLLLWKPAIVAGAGPLDALKRSWEATRGHFWTLFGVALLASLVINIIEWAMSAALGSTFLLLGRSLGSPVVAQIVPLLIVALVSVAFQVVTTVFLAFYYRRAA